MELYISQQELDDCVFTYQWLKESFWLAQEFFIVFVKPVFGFIAIKMRSVQ